MTKLVRGAVLSPAVVRANSWEVRGDVPLLAALPSALVYWDKILLPHVAVGRMPLLDQAFDPLIDMGVGETFDVGTGLVGFMAGPIISEIKEGVRERTARPNETWSYLLELEDGASTEDLIGQAAGQAEQLLSLKIALYEALPVPPPNTPFEDIVRYRRERADELARLHEELEAIAAVYANDASPTDAAAKALARLERALADVETTQKEKWSAVIKRSLSYAAVFDAAIPAASLAGMGQSLDFSLALGAGSAAVRAVWEGLKGVGEAVKAHPFAYAVGFDTI